jgi:hypothetical protein
MEETMSETRLPTNKKNPLGAAVLSTLPGVGFFYLGNYIKGFAYLLIFISLLVLAANSRGAEIPAFVLMSVGFYIFQIFDTFDEAKKIAGWDEETRKKRMGSMPLASSVAILVVGVILQLTSLDILSYRQITRFWPLILIAMGVKYIYGYSKNLKQKEGEEHE